MPAATPTSAVTAITSPGLAGTGASHPGSTSAPRSGGLAARWRRWHLSRHLLRLVSLAVLVGLWQVASMHRVHLGVVTFANVPAPTEVVAAGWDLLHSPKVVPHVCNSLFRVFAGFLLAAVVGIGLGLAIGRWRLAEDLAMPALELLRPIPGVAWIPLAILMFPSSEASMVYITFMGALFPILLSTIHAVESIDRRLIAAARSLGAGRWSIFTEVILPGAAPGIATGLAIGMGTAWFCLVTAEMIAGQYGIGYYTWESYNLQRYAEIIVGMAAIGIFGTVSSALVRFTASWLMPWQRLRAGKT